MDSEQAFCVTIFPLVRRLAVSFAKNIRFGIESDDLTQVGLIAAISLYRDKGGVPDQPLINRTIRRQFIDELRRITHYGKRTDTQQLDTSDKRESNAVPSHEEATIRDIDLERAIAMLNPKEQAIFRDILAGKTLYEIGDVYGVSCTRIAQIKSEATRRIRRSIRKAHEKR